MNPYLLVAVLVALVGGALHTALWGTRARARRRLARGSTTIEDHTVVTLTGVVHVLDDLLEAPLSGRPCVGFLVTATMYKEEGSAENDAIGRYAICPFVLETAHESVVVDSTTAEILIPTMSLIPRRLEREKAFLAGQGIPLQRIRYSAFAEASIAAGDKIRVQGLALVELVPPDAATDAREATRRIRLVARPEHPLTIGPAR